MTVECPPRPRSERVEELGFVRQAMVSWLDPRQLVQTASRVIFSAIFAAYSDKREIQAALETEDVLDRSQDGELWIDFVADLGDGFDSTYTIAWLLAQSELNLRYGDTSATTKRGRLLVMGGDQVYPTASLREYQNRTLGPYSAALPCVPDGPPPELLAVPGNHDWYDGLTNFIRIFCQKHWIGGWHTLQKRSYFAIKLPHRWWLWGIDIQFDNSYIDDPQLAYFQNVAQRHVAAGDRIILCTAKPSWVYAATEGPESYRNLDYFVRKIIEPSKAQLQVSISGDSHHYCRFEEEGGTRQLITAGGGAAFLSPTHHLPKTLGPELSLHPDSPKRTYQRRSEFPSAAKSRRLLLGALAIPIQNPSLWPVLRLVQLLLVWTLQLGPKGFVAGMQSAGPLEMAASFVQSPTSWLAAILVCLALGEFAKFPGWRRWLVGLVHASVQISVMLVVAWLTARVLTVISVHGIMFVFLLAVLVWSLGGLMAGLVLGLYLIASSWGFGIHDNEAFSAMHIKDYKNFLRMRLGEDGTLTLFPIGIDRVCRRWRLDPHGDVSSPWFGAVDPIDVRLLESPVLIGPISPP